MLRRIQRLFSLNRQDMAAAMGLILATTIYFSPYILTGKGPIAYDLLSIVPPWNSLSNLAPQNRMMFDVVWQYVPWRTLYRESLLSGEIPFWNPYVFSGMPALANQQVGIFYPPNLFFLMAGVETGYTIFLGFHLFITGLGMYLLLRRLTLRPPAALAGALTWMFCGFLTVWLPWLSIAATLAWLPWCLLFADWFLDKGGKRALGMLALSVCLVLLGGHAQFAYYSLLCTGAFALWRTFASAVPWRQRAGRFLGFVGGVLLGVLASAIQLVPTFELSRQGTRGALPISELMGGAIPGRHLLTLLVPEFYGNANLYHGAGNFVEFTGYVGIAGLLLAGISLLHPGLHRRSSFWFFGLLAALALHLAYGGVLNIPFSYLPGYTSFRGLQRIYSLWSLGMAGIVAWGVEAALLARNWRRWLISATALVLLAGGLASLPQTDGIRDWMVQMSAVTPPLGWEERVGGPLQWSLWLVAGTGLALTGLLLVARIPRNLGLLLAWTPAVLIGADLTHFSRSYLPVVDSSRAYPSTPGLAYLQAHRTEGRVARFSNTWSMPANSGIMYGLEDIDGYDSFTLDRYNRLVGLIEPDRYKYVGHFNTFGNFQQIESVKLPILDLLGATFLVTVAPLPVADSGARVETCNQPVGELIAGSEVGQTFQVTGDGLYRVDISMATYARTNHGRLRLELRSAPDDPRVLAWQEIDVSTMADNREVPFQFAPITPSAGRSFYVSMQGLDGAPDNAVTAWVNSNDVYRAGSVWRNRRPDGGDLCFRAYTQTALEEVGWAQAYSGEDMTIYRNQQALPLAFLVTEVQVRPTGEDQLAALAGPDFQPARQAVMDQAPVLPLDPWATGNTRIARRTLNALELNVQVNAAPGQAALLIIRQNDYPGWTARIDGVDTPILLVDYNLQGLLLTAGDHEVTLQFMPSYFMVGMFVSLLACAGVACLLLGRGSGNGYWRP